MSFRKRPLRSKNYRLPLGAIGCIFVWFLWMISTHHRAENHPLQIEAKSTELLSGPVKLYDFSAMKPFEGENKKLAINQLACFALNLRHKNDDSTRAHIILPSEASYEAFMSVARFARKEGLSLRFKGETLVLFQQPQLSTKALESPLNEHKLPSQPKKEIWIAKN